MAHETRLLADGIVNIQTIHPPSILIPSSIDP